MKFIRPHAVTDATLTSHSVAEADYTVWSAATSYSVGQRVIRTQTHRVYECLIAGVNATTPEAAPTRWLDVAPTNRWAAFDKVVGTKTTATGSMTISITPDSRFDSVALLDVKATIVEVSVELGPHQIYKTTVVMASTEEPVVDYFTYWQAEFTSKSVLVLTDLPSTFGGATLTVTLSNSADTGSVALGTLSVGRLFDLGGTQYGASAGITDYSVIETDTFGVTKVVQRAYAKNMTVKCEVDNANYDSVIRMLTAYRAQPVVWIGSDVGYEALIVYGFAKDWAGQIDYPTLSYLPITIRGLT